MIKDDLDLESLVTLSMGFSGAEVVASCTEAAMHVAAECCHALYNGTNNADSTNNNTQLIAQSHVEDSIKKITPQITPQMIEFYENFTRNCI